MSQFEVGEVVQLRSGGPRMTVSHLQGERITCHWFSGDKVEEETFVSKTLKKIIND